MRSNGSLRPPHYVARLTRRQSLLSAVHTRTRVRGEHVFERRKPRILCGELYTELFVLLLQACDRRLLFADCVHKHGANAVVLDAFDLALRVVRHEQRLDAPDFFRDEAEVWRAALLPTKT